MPRYYWVAPLIVASFLTSCPSTKPASQEGEPPAAGSKQSGDSSSGSFPDLGKGNYTPFNGQYPDGWPTEIKLPADLLTDANSPIGGKSGQWMCMGVMHASSKDAVAAVAQGVAGSPRVQQPLTK